MNKIKLIIWREFITRVRKPSFLIMTILGPVLIAGGILLMAWIGTQEAVDHQVLVVDPEGVIGRKLEDSKSVRFTLTGESWSDTAFKESPFTIRVELLEGAVTFPPKAVLHYKTLPSEFAMNHIRGQLDKAVELAKLRKNGIDPEVYEKVRTPIDIKSIDFADLGRESFARERATIGFILGYFMLIFIMVYGMQVMRSVMEEKQNRIIEVLISSVKPFQLMMGKIVGVAMVGITQFLLWIIMTTIMVTVGLSIFASSKFDAASLAENGMTTQVQKELVQQVESGAVDESKVVQMLAQVNFPLVLLTFGFFFIGGYLLYSSLLAAIGSAVDSETDTQQFMMPVLLPMMIGILIASIGMQNAGSNLVFWGSMIPFTAPVVMIMRVVMGTAPVWQLLLSMFLLIATFIFTTWLAGRIYRTGILMYGKKVSWKEMGKWLFYRG